ncbi:NYN domain-containing protein [Salibaculum halophilum]|uniref:NYN domain-containing protein n=1 Tax=Salibaculum halophilum TaxID=1914408 RepID=UPI002481FBAE|nr:NYN domain-containing protein [Salibaculum halophilum]
MAFFDGQNLFQHAMAAFGHHHPNYDPIKLHNAVCAAHGWTPNLVRFYTGVPDPRRQKMWAGYWDKRIIALQRSGVSVTKRTLRYREVETKLPDGSTDVEVVPQEKGVDVRLALDLVKCARRREFDVAVLFSQDQDLSEVVDEVKEIASEQGRNITICCPFPYGPKATVKRGVDRTNWFRMDEAFYNECLDPKDYRPPK